jgi:nucleotide-binding universal stress UspA family protein
MLRLVFRHILIPTDGTPRAAKAVRTGVRLARALGARVTALHVACAYLPPAYMPAVSRSTLKRLIARETDQALRPVLAAARQARVRCKVRTVVAGEPWQAIVRATRTQRCDLVVMASHARGALGNLFLGSETLEVLARSRVPVLVVR